jgi:hypothetical protein
VKVLFGNYGTKEDLLDNLRAFAAEAEATKELWRAVALDYERGADGFPARVHVNSLIFRWVWEQAETNAHWAAWAIREVGAWPDVAEPADREAALEVFRAALRPESSPG